MAEKKKTVSRAKPASGRKKSPARTVRTARPRPSGKKTGRFFEGSGNEVTGMILIGFGLLLTAGIFTDQTGRVGELLKYIAIAGFGSLGYVVPVLFAALGLAFILRRRGFLKNTRALGAVIILISLLIMLSASHMYLLDKMTLREALAEISLLRTKGHGGVLGYLMAYPFILLFGEVGAYIFSFLGILLGLSLIFNTTLYDSLRKGKEVSGKVHTRISDFKEKNNELKAEAMRSQEQQAVSGQKDAAASHTASYKNQIKSRFLGKADPADPSALDLKADHADKKLSLPAFLETQRAAAGFALERSEGGSRFNIQMKGQPLKAAARPELKQAPDGAANPVTVPYLESWNQVRDKKNPRLQPAFDAVKRPPAEPAVETEEVPVQSAAPEPKTKTETAALTEQAFQDYRKNRLAETVRAGRDKGEQITMENEEEKPKPIYKYPGVALLRENMRGMMDDEDHHEILENARKLQDTLGTFGVEARVIDVSKGPSVTRYELQLKAGIKVSKVTNLSDDIALALAAPGVRIEAPIPGKAAVGIEIPNRETVPVFLREVIDSEKFTKSPQKLAMGLGKDISGEIIIGDIAKFPHVLIAGATGSGKSVCINSLIVSLLYKYTPEEVRLIMVDPKIVELSVYNGIPHLLVPVVTDPKKAAGALNWAVNEMTRRYDLFNTNGVRNIEGYNDLKEKGRIEKKLPYIVIVVDELADLMMVAAGEVESYIARLAQMARAAGMHLVIATQRPSVDVITGVIKANIPSRISFAVSSYVDSKTILDQGGAEKLLGKGDMLYSPMGAHKPKRVQGAFISEEEVEAIVAHIKVKEDVRYDESIIEHIEKGGAAGILKEEESDELFDEAVQIVIEHNQASTSFLQRRMRIGYNRAARIMDELEQKGVISGPDGAKPRRVLWGNEDL